MNEEYLFGKAIYSSQWDQLSDEEKTFKTLQGYEVVPDYTYRSPNFSMPQFIDPRSIQNPEADPTDDN